MEICQNLALLMFIGCRCWLIVEVQHSLSVLKKNDIVHYLYAMFN